MAIRVDAGGDLQFVVCKPIQIEGVAAEYAASPGNWETFWDFSGTAQQLEADVTIDESVLRTQFSGHATRPEFASGGAISIALNGPSSTVSLLGVYRLPDNLNGALWLQSDGTQTDSPC